jgi:hypothetical protein
MGYPKFVKRCRAWREERPISIVRSGAGKYAKLVRVPARTGNRGGVESGFQPSAVRLTTTQGFALGWYETGLWPLACG